ncbi:L-aspartate oxidase, partial [hydrothermal vent metagenome]
MSNKLNNRQTYRHEVLIIGGGAAGLSLALNLPAQMRVAIITKDRDTEGSTYYAQGGISAVLRAEDSFDSHIQDTLNAGDGLCDIKAAQFTIENGPDAINWLADLGVPFTTDKHTDGRKSWHLTREGGHSHRRVIHAADATGKALETTLLNHVKHSRNIEL